MTFYHNTIYSVSTSFILAVINNTHKTKIVKNKGQKKRISIKEQLNPFHVTSGVQFTSNSKHAVNSHPHLTIPVGSPNKKQTIVLNNSPNVPTESDTVTAGTNGSGYR